MLEAIAAAWRDRRDEVKTSAAQLVEAVGRSTSLRPSNEPLSDAVLSAAVGGLRASFEPAYGGWGRAPKFPNAPVLEFLLRRDTDDARAMVTKTLDEMAAGGMYDLLGGGFHRYSVDDRWLVPHFEKMLYDNALLAATYLHGWLVTGNERYREVTRADDRVHAARAAAAGGRLRLGAGRRHRRRRGPDLHLDRGGGRARGSPGAVRARPVDHPRRVDEETRTRLLELRELRPKPLRDDKAIASWNGLALAALAEAARRLERPDWTEAARNLGSFLLGPLSGEDGRLRRSRRDGRTSGPGYLDDYANVAHGLLELHIATGELRWLEEASRLARLAVELFADDEHGGFFLSPVDGERLVARTRTSTTIRFHRATRCSLTCSSGSPGSTVTTSSSGAAWPCSGSCGRHSSGRPPPSAGRSARSTCT